MSVAFRRDSDEEHLEPRFELPIPIGPNFVTPRGLELIEQRANELSAALQEAPDDETAKSIARDLRYWRTRRATAEVVALAAGDSVAFGSHVRILINGSERELQIVGQDEADIAAGRIGFAAPLARCLMGAVAGDLIDMAGHATPIEVLAVNDEARHDDA